MWPSLYIAALRVSQMMALRFCASITYTVSTIADVAATAGPEIVHAYSATSPHVRAAMRILNERDIRFSSGMENLILHLTRKCGYEGALALQHDTSYLMNLNTRPSAINPAKNATLNTIPATTVARANAMPDKPRADVPHHASNVPGTAALKMATTDSK